MKLPRLGERPAEGERAGNLWSQPTRVGEAEPQRGLPGTSTYVEPGAAPTPSRPSHAQAWTFAGIAFNTAAGLLLGTGVGTPLAVVASLLGTCCFVQATRS